MSGTMTDRLTVSNDTRHLLAVRDFTARLARHGGFDPAEAQKIVSAIDEAVTNIIEHGYNRGERGSIELLAELAPDRFRMVIRDTARVFNPASVPAPDMAEHVKSGRKKGLGLYMMRQFMDEVSYRYKDGAQNELTLVKYSRTKT